MFSQWERLRKSHEIDFEAFIRHVKFDSHGLIPVIAQQFDSKEVLMMAWMNRDALSITCQEGRVCYWSRSRQSLWRKGESSGHIQYLHSLAFDCDGDAILALVDQKGPAGHTLRRSCFFFHLTGNKVVVGSDSGIDNSQHGD